MTGMFKDSSTLAARCGGDALAGAESSFSEARADSQLVAGPTSRCLRGSSTPSTCEAVSVPTSHGPLQDFAMPLALLRPSPRRLADQYCGTNAAVGSASLARLAVPVEN